MSGARVPYQVRPNKYVERQLFVEMLSHAGRIVDLQNSFYVSMGGRTLEDFKLVHNRLNLRKMISIEMDCVTFGGQQFNCPVDLIDCKMMTSRELVESFEDHVYDHESNVIVWLDYAIAKQRGQQLSEFSTLISKLKPYDIAKITLNSSFKTLGESDASLVATEPNNNTTPMEKRLCKLRRQLGDFLDVTLGPNDLESSVFPNILADSVGRAAVLGNSSDPSTFVEPISAFVYNDGYHDMLTVSCIVLPYDLEQEASHALGLDDGQKAKRVIDHFNDRTGLGRWAFRAIDWQNVRRIAIPDLSIKERLRIHDALRESKGDMAKVLSELPFRLGVDDEDVTQETIEMYWEFYRYYPNYLPVAI